MPKQIVRVRAAALAASLLFSLGGASAQAPEPSLSLHWREDAPWMKLSQGWSDEDRLKFWSTPQGSLVVPYSWFESLERADGKGDLASRESLASFGFITLEAPVSPGGPLAIGLVDETGPRDGRWLGFTCAACHTGSVKFGNKRILVAGGASVIRFVDFHDALTAAMRRSLDDAVVFDRFYGRVNSKTPIAKDELKSWLLEETRAREQYIKANTEGQHPGPGRVDALGIIFNSVAGRDLGRPENIFPADAPVSFPALWDTHKFDRVQYNAVVTNTGAGPLVRNVGQVLGVFGQVSFEQGWPIPAYKSTAKLENLQILEGLLSKLDAPRWPENVLPVIDKTRLTEGKQIFDRACAQCHITARGHSEFPVHVEVVPLDVVKTDPKTATNVVKNVVSSGPLEGRKAFVVAGPAIEQTMAPGLMLAHTAIGVVLDSPLLALEGDLENMYADQVAPLPSPTSYKARPLDGVWATAPYLHNGSVRSLYQLLLPSDQREKAFSIGDNEFDPVNVGLSDKVAEPFVFDTTLPGNSAAGHDFGVDLSDAQRRALIEYLKTL